MPRPRSVSVSEKKQNTHPSLNTNTKHGCAVLVCVWCRYGGSGALKGDFTRTGQRTFKGLLRDGALSLLRYRPVSQALSLLGYTKGYQRHPLLACLLFPIARDKGENIVRLVGLAVGCCGRSHARASACCVHARCTVHG